MAAEFQLSDYWIGESKWSEKILPQIFEDDRYVGTYYEFVKETQIKISEISEEAGTN